MQKLKRIASIVLTVCMMLSMAVNVQAVGVSDYVNVALEETQIKVTPGASHVSGDIRVIIYKSDLTFSDSDLQNWSTISIATEDNNFPPVKLTASNFKAETQQTSGITPITVTYPDGVTGTFKYAVYSDNSSPNMASDTITLSNGKYVAPKATATVTITAPTANAHLNAKGLKTFAGGTSADSTGAVSKVMWTLADESGKYWNGTDKFDELTYKWAAASTANSWANWTLDLSNIAGELTNGDAYTLFVYAQDRNTGLDTDLMESVSFVYDITPPSPTFSPATGSSLMTGAARTVTIELSEKLYGVNNTAAATEIAEGALTSSGAVTVANGASGTTDITSACTFKYVTGDTPKITVTIPSANLTAEDTVKVNIVGSKLVDSAGNAMAAATASYTVSDGTPTYMSTTTEKHTYKYAANHTLESTVGAETALSADTVAKALGLKVGTATGGTGTDLTNNGTWSWGNSSEGFAAGSNTLTLKWSPSNPINSVTYAPCTTSVTVLAKKILGATNFQPNGSTLDKPFDGNNKLLDGAKAEVADADKILANEYTVKIVGTYNNAQVGVDKQINTTQVTEVAPSDYYVLEDSLTALSGLDGDITQVAPVFSITETEVALDSAKAEGYTVKVNGLDMTTAGLTKAVAASAGSDKYEVRYWIATPEHVDTTLCTCAEVKHLAHTVDCARVTDATHATTCDCGAGDSVQVEKQHESACGYKQTASSTDCSCSIKDAATDKAVHGADCPAIVAATSEWTESYNASSYLSGLKVGDTVYVHVCLPNVSNTNFTQLTFTNSSSNEDPIGGSKAKATGSFTVKDNPSTGGGGGGGGTSSYTVKFDAGKNGKITKGSASTSVSSGSKVASSKVPTVEANDGYKFLGWSLDGKTTVDPTEQKITKSVTFTALYTEEAVLNKEDHMAYIKGYDNGTFRPGNNITRAEVAAIFSRILKNSTEVAGSGSSAFKDVAASAWYAPYVTVMEQQGLLKGYNDNTFRPEASITREEFVAMATRVVGVTKAGELPFTDVAADRWSVDNIYTAYTNGWIKGYDGNTFRPEAKLTRAEAVTMVNAMLERKITAESISGATYKSFSDVPSGHWAYLDVIEASTEHQYTKDGDKETWTK